MLLEYYFCAVRKSEDGKEWFHSRTLSLDIEETQRLADNFDLEFPNISRNAPVVRIARVKMEEI